MSSLQRLNCRVERDWRQPRHLEFDNQSDIGTVTPDGFKPAQWKLFDEEYPTWSRRFMGSFDKYYGLYDASESERLKKLVMFHTTRDARCRTNVPLYQNAILLYAVHDWHSKWLLPMTGLLYGMAPKIQAQFTPLRRCFAHANQPLNTNLKTVSLVLSSNSQITYHPVATLIQPVPLDLYLQLCCGIVVSSLKKLGEVIKFADSVRREKVFIVQMIEKDIKTLLCILHLCGERWRGFASNTLHITAENADHLLGVCLNV